MRQGRIVNNRIIKFVLYVSFKTRVFVCLYVCSRIEALDSSGAGSRHGKAHRDIIKTHSIRVSFPLPPPLFKVLMTYSGLSWAAALKNKIARKKTRNQNSGNFYKTFLLPLCQANFPLSVRKLDLMRRIVLLGFAFTHCLSSLVAKSAPVAILLVRYSLPRSCFSF